VAGSPTIHSTCTSPAEPNRPRGAASGGGAARPAGDPHTLVKHLVYRHYLACWTAKIHQMFSVATTVDAFAGPGVYEDGPGQ
jgi:hypothetical protein